MQSCDYACYASVHFVGDAVLLRCCFFLMRQVIFDDKSVSVTCVSVACLLFKKTEEVLRCNFVYRAVFQGNYGLFQRHLHPHED